jgi:hypothetical protein
VAVAVEVVGVFFVSLSSEGFDGSVGFVSTDFVASTAVCGVFVASVEALSWDIAVVTQDAVNKDERIETLTPESKRIRQLIVQQPLALIVVGNHG